MNSEYMKTCISKQSNGKTGKSDLVANFKLIDHLVSHTLLESQQVYVLVTYSLR